MRVSYRFPLKRQDAADKRAQQNYSMFLPLLGIAMFFLLITSYYLFHAKHNENEPKGNRPIRSSSGNTDQERSTKENNEGGPGIFPDSVTKSALINWISSSPSQPPLNNQIPRPGAVKNPPQKSKFAYVTLISGFSKNYRYRGFLYNAMIMKKALDKYGSKADFIALIGFSDNDTVIYEPDLNLLRNHGISVYVLPRLVDESLPFIFAEMALLKVTPWNFTQYDRLQFLDGDVMPYRNMDCFFQLSMNTFTVGAVSPLNSGWYLAIPSREDHDSLIAKAKWRLHCDWDRRLGWSLPMDHFDLSYRGGNKRCVEWQFNGADMDQGLLTHYFVLNHGNALLIDTDTQSARVFKMGLLHAKDKKGTMQEALSCCDGLIPTNFFAHFTGQSKPWMIGSSQQRKPPRSGSYNAIWMQLLDDLKLPINSSNIESHNLGSPLGFWNVNFPKKNRPCQSTETR